MADKLFLQAFSHASARRFERRLGLPTGDVSKSCGARFLSNLESAIFSRAAGCGADERMHDSGISGSPFPRRNTVRG